MHVELGDKVRMVDEFQPDHLGKVGTITECSRDTFDGNIEITFPDGTVTNYPILNWSEEEAFTEPYEPSEATYPTYDEHAEHFVPA